jgi:hypothetical protein
MVIGEMDVVIAGPEDEADSYREWITERIRAGELTADDHNPDAPLTVRFPDGCTAKPFLALLPSRWPHLGWSEFSNAIPPGDQRCIPTLPKLHKIAPVIAFMEIGDAEPIVIGGPPQEAEAALKQFIARDPMIFWNFGNRKLGQWLHLSCADFGKASDACARFGAGFPKVGWMTLSQYEASLSPSKRKKLFGK